MDAQLKRGHLGVCVLAAIKNGESYGDKIIRDMKPYLEMSESTLYTMLKRLETAGLPADVLFESGDVEIPATASGGVCEIRTDTGDVKITLS